MGLFGGGGGSAPTPPPPPPVPPAANPQTAASAMVQLAGQNKSAGLRGQANNPANAGMGYGGGFAAPGEMDAAMSTPTAGKSLLGS